MKKLIVLFSSVLLLVSCKEKNDGEHFSREKMSSILLDIHYAEVYSTMVNDSLHQIKNKNKDSLVIYYADILKHHNVTPEAFKQSMSWYEMHPGELEWVYIDMLNAVTQKESQLQGDNKKEEE